MLYTFFASLDNDSNGYQDIDVETTLRNDVENCHITAVMKDAAEQEETKTQEPEDCGTCPICLETMERTDVEALPCSHLLHQQCLQQMLASDTAHYRQSKCPTCRFPLRGPPADLVSNSDSDEDMPQYEPEPEFYPDPEPEPEPTPAENALALLLRAVEDCPDEPLETLARRFSSATTLFDPEVAGTEEGLADRVRVNHSFSVGRRAMYLVGAYNTAHYVAAYQLSLGRVSRAAALRRLNIRGLNATSASLYIAFAKVIDKYRAYKFLYVCSENWNVVRTLLPRGVLDGAFAQLGEEYLSKFQH